MLATFKFWLCALYLVNILFHMINPHVSMFTVLNSIFLYPGVFRCNASRDSPSWDFSDLVKSSQVYLEKLGRAVICAPTMLFTGIEKACAPGLKTGSKETRCCVSTPLGTFFCLFFVDLDIRGQQRCSIWKGTKHELSRKVCSSDSYKVAWWDMHESTAQRL